MPPTPLDSEYTRVLHVPGFLIYQAAEYDRVLNGFEYARVLIYHGFKNTRITQGSEYV